MTAPRECGTPLRRVLHEALNRCTGILNSTPPPAGGQPLATLPELLDAGARRRLADSVAAAGRHASPRETGLLGTALVLAVQAADLDGVAALVQAAAAAGTVGDAIPGRAARFLVAHQDPVNGAWPGDPSTTALCAAALSATAAALFPGLSVDS